MPGDKPRLSEREVAERAALEGTFVARLVQLGILAAGSDGAFSESDVRRARILHSLDLGGFPIPALAEAIRQGTIDLGFVDEPGWELFAGSTDMTFGEVTADTGVPLDLLFAIRESMGSAPPAAGDHLRPMEAQAVPAVRMMHAHGVRPQVIERALRAYGDNLRKVAEVEADWWMSDVMQPIMDEGGGMTDIGPRTAKFAGELWSAEEQLLLALFHGHQSNAWIKNIFEGFEQALERAGLHQPVERPPAICFLDLSGYTRLTEERGDAAAADLAGRLARLVQRTSGQHGGKPIKWLGDGVMFHFRDPGPGVQAALEMVEGAREADLPPAHVGLHAGPVLFQEGDYFGRTVNVAARIADYARQGEVLVSDEVVAASALPGVRFDLIGPVELKGLAGTISLHAAHRAG